jgi:hypothetical protein
MAQMTDIAFPQLLDSVRATRGAHYKLTILAGQSRAGNRPRGPEK